MVQAILDRLKVLDNGTGGGGEAEGTVSISITENGTITRNVARYASAEITTNVPNPSTGTKQISIAQNGTTTEDITNYASAQITTNVPNSYTSSDEGQVAGTKRSHPRDSRKSCG